MFSRVLLCVIQEGGRTKSHRYWPKLGSKHSSATYGKFKVTTKFRTDSGCYATTGLKVKHLLSGQERTVWHLQYTDWPHHGCPEDVQGFLCKFFPDWVSLNACVSSQLERRSRGARQYQSAHLPASAQSREDRCPCVLLTFYAHPQDHDKLILH